MKITQESSLPAEELVASEVVLCFVGVKQMGAAYLPLSCDIIYRMQIPLLYRSQRCAGKTGNTKKM